MAAKKRRRRGAQLMLVRAMPQARASSVDKDPVYMSSNVSDAYLEARVMSASPVELVRILYDAARGAVREARRHLDAGDIAARSRQISKACAILVELTASLDESRGAEIASRLKALYDYCGMRLLDANLRQSDEPLAEVLSLLETLTEAWSQVGVEPAEPAQATPQVYASPVGYGAMVAGEQHAFEPHSWSV